MDKDDGNSNPFLQKSESPSEVKSIFGATTNPPTVFSSISSSTTSEYQAPFSVPPSTPVVFGHSQDSSESSNIFGSSYNNPDVSSQDRSTEHPNIFGNTLKNPDDSSESANIFGGKLGPSVSEIKTSAHPQPSTTSLLSASSTQIPHTSGMATSQFQRNFSSESTDPLHSVPSISSAAPVSDFSSPSMAFSSQTKQSTITHPTVFGGEKTTIFGAASVSDFSSPNLAFSSQTKQSITTHATLFGGEKTTTFGFASAKPSTATTFKTLSSFGSSESLEQNKHFQKQALFGGKPSSSSSSVPKSVEKVSQNKDIFPSTSLAKAPVTLWQENVSEIESFPYQKRSTDSASQKEENVIASKAKLEPVHPKIEPTMLIAVDIPENFVEKSVLENHFNKYGAVKEIVMNKKTNQASIFFKDHKSAANAKLKGKKLHPLIPEMKLFFGSNIQAPAPSKQPDFRQPPAPSPRQPDFRQPQAPSPRQPDFRQPVEKLKPKTGRKTLDPPQKITKTSEPFKLFGDSKRASLEKPKISKLFDIRSFIEQPAKSFSPENSPFSKPTSTPPSPVTFGSNRPPVPKVFEKAKQTSPEVVSDKKAPAVKKIEIKSKAPSENLATIKDSFKLIACEAKNSYDRYLILDARDKIIRSKAEKVLDVKRARYLRATCPDMCPEKERYSREIQYDVSAFEMSNGEMDPKLMVKKFSRSSADKDEPLPHELRPGPTLKMTMDYLNLNIISRGSEESIQIDLWYNYLCNRTRGLRNDISQQHLVDANAIYVLERCTRFHIHCSHSLCEELPDYFDAKMNAEHLGKSLQSLKELYNDLGESGIYFETEAEFRAYEILLGANDGNIIFKYLKFHEPVRKSPLVQFAIQVLHSLNTNNYIKFFKLLKNATYLQACIMHKYFSGIRLKALPLIVKVYKSQDLPVEKVMLMLGFPDEIQLQNYIRLFGIDINDESKVVISKVPFLSHPENLPYPTKSKTILAKANNSLSKIVENGNLPENPLGHYKPHDSFNFMGYLKEEAVNAKDQSPSHFQFKTRKEEKESEIVPMEKLSDSFEKEASQDEGDVLTSQDNNVKLEQELAGKIDKMRNFNLLLRYFKNWKDYCRYKSKARTALVKRLGLLWRTKAAKLAIIRRKSTINCMRYYFGNWKCFVESARQRNFYLSEVRMIECSILMKKYYNMWKLKWVHKKCLRESKVAREYLLSRKYLNLWRVWTQTQIAEQKSKAFYEFSVLACYFNRWKQFCISVKDKRTRLSFESFPAISSQLSPREQNELLAWGYDRDDKMNLSIQQISEIDETISSLSEKHFSIQQLSSFIAWSSLPLIQRFRAEVRAGPHDISGNICDKYFKILLLVDEQVEPYLLQWVRRKFDLTESKDFAEPLEAETRFTVLGNTYRIIVNEKVLTRGVHSLDGASIVVFVGNVEVKLKFDNFCASHENITALALLWNDVYDSFEGTTSWTLKKETIDKPIASEKLFDFVYNKWSRRRENCNMLICRLPLVVNKAIARTVLDPVYFEIQRRERFYKPGISPSEIVMLYNASIDHLKSSLEKSKSLAMKVLPSELSQSPEHELKFNFEEFESVIIDLLPRSSLPPFLIKPETFCEDKITEYLNDVALGEWSAGLESEIRRIIKQRLSRRETADDDWEDTITLSYYTVPWVDVLMSCIFFKLSFLPDINILYVPSYVDSFDQELWMSRLRGSEDALQARVEESTDNTAKRKETAFVDSEPKRKKTVKSQLLSDIEEERRKTIEYEKSAKSCLIAEDEMRRLCEVHGIDIDNLPALE